MKSLDQKPTQETKKCSHCCVVKPLSEFSFRNTEMRYESKCKICRRKLRREQHNANNKGHDLGAAQTKREPRTEKLTPKRIIEPHVGMTSAKVQAIDFGDLERHNGKPLTEVEKHDAVERFNQFIKLLREGYSEMKGYDVFIRKN